MASNYNHALRPPVVAVRGGSARVVVRRESVDDLLATEVGAEAGVGQPVGDNAGTTTTGTGPTPSPHEEREQ